MKQQLAFNRFIYVDSDSADSAVRFLGVPGAVAIKTDNGLFGCFRTRPHADLQCDECGVYADCDSLTIIRENERLLCSNCLAKGG